MIFWEINFEMEERLRLRIAVINYETSKFSGTTNFFPVIMYSYGSNKYVNIRLLRVAQNIPLLLVLSETSTLLSLLR